MPGPPSVEAPWHLGETPSSTAYWLAAPRSTATAYRRKKIAASVLPRFAGRYGQHQVSQRLRIRDDLVAVEPEKGEGGGQGHSLVSIQERVILGEVKEIGRGHFEEGRVEVLAVKGGLRAPSAADRSPTSRRPPVPP